MRRISTLSAASTSKLSLRSATLAFATATLCAQMAPLTIVPKAKAASMPPIFSAQPRPLARFVKMLNDHVAAAAAAAAAATASSSSDDGAAPYRATSAAEDVVREFRQTFRPSSPATTTAPVDNNEDAAAAAAAAAASAAPPLLEQYCGSQADVVPLASIVLRACIDIGDVDTARFLFALVLRECASVPEFFFRLYLEALSRSDATTFEELSGVITRVGFDRARGSSVMKLCILEVKLRCGFDVTIDDVRECCSDFELLDSKNSSRSSSSSSRSSRREKKRRDAEEEAERRMKLRDCFGLAVRSHPDPRVPTLLLHEWTASSELSEFLSETALVMHFLLTASSNDAASAALCADLLTLLDGLARAAAESGLGGSQQQQHQQQQAQLSDGTESEHQQLQRQTQIGQQLQQHQPKRLLSSAAGAAAAGATGPDGGAVTAAEVASDNAEALAKQSTALVLPVAASQQQQQQQQQPHTFKVRTLFKCVAKAGRGCDWESMLKIEHFARSTVLNTAEPWIAAGAEASDAKNDTLCSLFAILRATALLETKRFDEFLHDCSASSSTSEVVGRGVKTAPLLFEMKFAHELERNSCPFFLHQTLAHTVVEQKQVRNAFSHNIPIPVTELPPMCLLFQACERAEVADGLLRAWLSQASSSSASPEKMSAVGAAAILVAGTARAGLCIGESSKTSAAVVEKVVVPVLKSHIDNKELMVLASKCVATLRCDDDEHHQHAQLEALVDFLAFEPSSREHFPVLLRSLHARKLFDAAAALSQLMQPAMQQQQQPIEKQENGEEKSAASTTP